MNGQHSYSVKSRHTGHNMCITVSSDFSCFPAALKAISTAPGQKCGADGRVFD
ncbi:hypothetical protein EXIGLDRAFT_722437 [Exidia glandulosa HHB12029]|uniref:Uncharacterized protein n=1 Tax=Exidia glandulosa HHB12029 TaxID=1314781 RepID=A0A165FB86_EXIGL|nr:hypothetical protein EXIGLDRAFT_722437 [Exidia glandulosa HHB12029]